jgi:hypothetical protein
MSSIYILLIATLSNAMMLFFPLKMNDYLLLFKIQHSAIKANRGFFKKKKQATVVSSSSKKKSNCGYRTQSISTSKTPHADSNTGYMDEEDRQSHGMWSQFLNGLHGRRTQNLIQRSFISNAQCKRLGTINCSDS